MGYSSCKLKKKGSHCQMSIYGSTSAETEMQAQLDQLTRSIHTWYAERLELESVRRGAWPSFVFLRKAQPPTSRPTKPRNRRCEMRP